MLGPQGPTFMVLFCESHIPLLFKISISGLGGGWETLACGDSYVCHYTPSFPFVCSYQRLLGTYLILFNKHVVTSHWMDFKVQLSFHCLFLFILLFIYAFLERGEGKEKGRETSMCGCLSCTSYWGPGLQLRHVLWLGTEPATLWFRGQHSIHWATPARALFLFISHHQGLGIRSGRWSGGLLSTSELLSPPFWKL